MSRVLSSVRLQNQDLTTAPSLPLPHNIEAEQGLLGALLVDNNAYDRIADILSPEHFYVPVHGRIFDAICNYLQKGQNASPVTLKSFFQADPDLDNLGGAAYLSDLAANVISLINTEDYARTIRACHQQRCLLDIADDMALAARGQDIDATPAQIIEDAEQRLYALAETGSDNHGLKPFSHYSLSALGQAERAITSSGKITGITTGLPSIDRKLGGLQDSDLIILAGRPSMGKTSLALNIAYNAARARLETAGEQGGVVAFFSLEMSGDQLTTRILADQAKLPSDAIRRGAIDQTALKACIDAAQSNNRLPLFIDQSGTLSLATLRSRARRLKRTHGLHLIIVDYLQLMHSPSRRNTDNRTAEVSEITRGLKQIAKDLDVPVLALSQLSRAPEMREDKRPQLSDLRESGSIEQDADVVIFVYREEYYLARTEPQPGTDDHLTWQQAIEAAANIAEAIIAKQRHGSIGTIKLNFEPAFTRFTDMGDL